MPGHQLTSALAVALVAAVGCGGVDARGRGAQGDRDNDGGDGPAATAPGGGGGDDGGEAPEVTATPGLHQERCRNGTDDDGDGAVDEGCICGPPGALQPCWPGAPERRAQGVCRDGVQVCVSTGGEFDAWGTCEGAVGPEEERCADASDNDCDGAVDEACTCVAGAVEACYDGPIDRVGTGTCVAGTRTCLVTGPEAVEWSACAGSVPPAAETCGDGLDNDCDGALDNGCPCLLGTTQACYPGAPGTAGVGVCFGGSQTCVQEGGSVAWGPCTGAVIPRREVCFDGIDQDCDGAADESCLCNIGDTRPCYGGPGGTEGRGTCSAGREVCTPLDDGSQVWSECRGQVTPRPDVCGDALDTDCDGVVDPGCLCIAGEVRACYPGPAPTRGLGICADGVETCRANGEAVSWSGCEGAVTPQGEACGDGVDQDCTGADLVCPPQPVVDIDVQVTRDCSTVCCPDSHPFPVGCNLNFSGGDSRGCVAYVPNAQCVYLQEGDVCGAGRVTGTMRCSTEPGGGLNQDTCPINKRNRFYVQRSSECPG